MDARTLRGWRTRIFFICWLTYAGYYLGRVNLAVALPSIQADLHWSKAAAGLIGSAFYWVYALGQLINGRLGDRLSARRLVAMGLVASALLNLAFGASSALPLMALIWAANGLAQSTGWGPMMKTLAHWFEPRQRGRLTALFMPCYVVGHAASWALGGWLCASRGWRYAFIVPGGLLLVLATAWFLLSRDGPDDATSPQPTPPSARPSLRQALADYYAALRHPQLSWAVGASFLSGMIKDGLTLWAPTYLVEQIGFDLSAAGLASAAVPLAGAVGAVGAGWATHRLETRRGAGGSREAQVVAGLAIWLGLVALALSLSVSFAPWLALLLLGAIALGSHGMNSLMMMSLPLSLGPQGKVSSAAGLLDFASYAGGGVSAVLMGLLQEQLGWGAVFGAWASVAGLILVIAWARRR